jgi:hypothetical protein
MITNRDISVLRFINTFGYSFIPIIGKTFFKNEITARARLRKLIGYGLLNKKSTSLINPKYAFYLTKESNLFLKDNFDEKALATSVKISRIKHLILEQISYFYLNEIGKVERTTVFNHYKHLNHIPDMIYTDEKERKFYIECETTVKSKQNYNELVLKTLKDNPYAIIYIIETALKAKTIAKAMPTSNKLYFICIDDLCVNIGKNKKISPRSQEDFLKKL